jgi:propanediol dehydratase small subunit
VSVPAETILDVYTALRPHRSSADELEAWAARLESEWDAPLTAAFVREAKDVYARRGLLAGERAQV